MKKYLLPGMLLMLLSLVCCTTDSAGKYEELERALNRRSEYAARKEARIDSLKRLVYPQMESERLFQLYNDIYNEYHTYRFDSAMFYVNLAAEVARKMGNRTYCDLSTIHRSVLLSTTGYFSESIRNLEQIDSHTLDDGVRVEYYTACEWAYSMWAEYSADQVYAPDYYRQEMLYQDSLVSVLPENSSFYYYWKAENLYRHKRYAEAKSFYEQALEGTPVNVRLYAMTTFGLALTVAQTGEWDKYEEYLIKAAISDQVCPLKENLALQELSLYIFNDGKGDMARANRYLGYSMEDAQFYNNRLRMLEIAQKFPSIVLSYQKQNISKSRRLQASLLCISLLSIGLIISLLYIRRQMRQLSRRRKALADMNEELKHLNDELKLLNKALVDMNHTREEYVSLFMDLCAAYIEKLNRYQDLVKRKVKAKQTDDLLKLVNATRLSDTDAKEFFVNFDTAFLNLYPDFIVAFNALLREGEEIVPKRGEILNTELRIFALVRMGVKDSSKIATLLFYSPQTIYNYRSAVKAKAKNKEEFEKLVEKLCTVM